MPVGHWFRHQQNLTSSTGEAKHPDELGSLARRRPSGPPDRRTDVHLPPTPRGWFRCAAKLDKVPGKRRPTLHDLRDTFASALIEAGLDVLQVSKQLGHADPAITLRVYADLFNRVRGAERTTLAIDSAFGTALEPTVATSGDPRNVRGKRTRLRCWFWRQAATSGEASAQFASRRSPVRSRYAP